MYRYQLDICSKNQFNLFRFRKHQRCIIIAQQQLSTCVYNNLDINMRPSHTPSLIYQPYTEDEDVFLCTDFLSPPCSGLHQGVLHGDQKPSSIINSLVAADSFILSPVRPRAAAGWRGCWPALSRAAPWPSSSPQRRTARSRLCWVSSRASNEGSRRFHNHGLPIIPIFCDCEI